MEALAAARALHVLAVVLWIGGVGMVTTVLLPLAMRRRDPAEGVALFAAIESRFGWQARFLVLLAGGSGFYMLERMQLWSRFAYAAFWWMHAMVLVWLIFATLLFVLEPALLHRRIRRRAEADPAGTLRLLHRAHLVLLALSIVTVLGAAAGSHGMMF